MATIDFVTQEIEEIELTPGPQGEKGEKGDKGDPGTTTWEGITNKPSSLPANGGNSHTVNGISIAVLTQSEYDELSTKSETTLYIIKG